MQVGVFYDTSEIMAGWIVRIIDLSYSFASVHTRSVFTRDNLIWCHQLPVLVFACETCDDQKFLFV